MAEELSSAEQDQWVEICAAARANIAKLVPMIPAMQPGEACSLIGAIDGAMLNAIRAATFDANVEAIRLSLERSSVYGS